MSSRQTTVDFIIEQTSSAGTVSARKMSGEYALYCGGKLFGLVCDVQLFIKPTEARRTFLGADVTEGQPYPGAKSCFAIPRELWDDSNHLAELVRITTAELPTARVNKPCPI